jgi:GNAT superfamily N-acetyltransferase
MKISLMIYKITKKDYISYFKNSIKFILEWEKWNVKWYWSILNWWFLFNLIAKKIKLDKNDFILWRHLYISKEYRWNWLAKIIKESQKEYAKKHNKKYIVWFTSSEKNLEIYQRYWAEDIWKIWNIFFYKYNLNKN